MAMDCCKGDSCQMMKEGEKKEGAAKSEGHKGCCGGGESCNMKDMKHMKTKDVKDSQSKP